MLSPVTIQQLDILHKTQNDYIPDPSIQVQLAAKTLFVTVGATCVGKNTVMDALVNSDPRFQMAKTFTTREPRDIDNGLYSYYQNTDEGLGGLLAEIAQHQVVQYAVNPHSHFVYGSHLGDYSAAYNLRDVFSGAVTGFRELGFKQVVAITIVADPQVWLARFETRFPMDNPDRTARRDEAVESLSWSLAQPDDGTHFWVVNVDGQPELAARAIVAIADGTYQSPADAKALAQATLTAARHITVTEPGKETAS